MKNKESNEDICRVCYSIQISHIFHWLDFDWVQCPACGSVMKDITASEYENLNPTYDPGHYSSAIHSGEELRDVIDVKKKVKRLIELAGDGKGKTFLDIGADTVIDLAKKFGFSHQLLPLPSLALGITEATVENSPPLARLHASSRRAIGPR